MDVGRCATRLTEFASVLCGGPIDFLAHVKAAREKPLFSIATHNHLRQPSFDFPRTCSSLLSPTLPLRCLRSSSAPARVPRGRKYLSICIVTLFMLSITLSHFWLPPSPAVQRKAFTAINVFLRRDFAMRARDNYRTDSQHDNIETMIDYKSF